jgi:hypothetical protein
MAQQRLVTKLEFSTRAGVSKPAISKALRGALGAALMGARINIDHPAAAAYLRAHGKSTAKPGTDRAPTRTPKATQKRTAAPTEPQDSDSKATPVPTARRPRGDNPPKLKPDEGLEQLAETEYADLTIRELADKWGTFTRFSDFLDALKTIAETTRLELQNEEKRGSVISREMVHKSIFGALDGMFSRLLGDMPRTIAGRLYALASSGAPREQAEQETRNLISSQLLPVKSRAAKALREPLAQHDD